MHLTKYTKYILHYRIQRYGIIQRRYKGFIPGEPSSPVIKTSVPGPKTKELLAELNKVQQAGTVDLFCNYQKSLGNYLVTADDNILLDCYCQIASIPLGYNHPDIINVFKNTKNVKTLINRPALGLFPNSTRVEQLCNSFMAIAPKCMTHIRPMLCGACGNETAMKACFIAYMQAKRGEKDFTCQELQSVMYNCPPGSPNLSVLSFVGAFHGRTLGMLTNTHSKPIHKLDMVVFDWPTAEFPHYKYPLSEHERENKEEDKRCLTIVKEQFDKWAKKENPVAAVIIEPIQSEGGDNHASKEFFQELQKIVKKNNAYLIIDEVQTGGGATGRYWHHETFDLPTPPDFVTFGKKMQLAGYYYLPEHRPKLPFRIFNSWFGDPSKMLILEKVIEVVKRDKILDNVVKAGNRLKSGLHQLEKQYPQLLNSTRGVGTFLAISACDMATRDKLIFQLKQKGVLCGGCGNNSIRFRPMLIFQESHADIFLDIFNKVLKELKK